MGSRHERDAAVTRQLKKAVFEQIRKQGCCAVRAAVRQDREPAAIEAVACVMSVAPRSGVWGGAATQLRGAPLL
eukprot:351309-Chlamydomonas_euryale.AAC.11